MNTTSLRITRTLGIAAVLLVVSGTAGTARAQIEPAAPGSVEYQLISNGQSWIETADPIVIDGYVEDTLTDRNNQPDGRGLIGIVTGISFDPNYNENAATVDFGRGYSAGIVFSELTSVQIVPEPASAGLILLPSVFLWRAVIRRHRR